MMARICILFLLIALCIQGARAQTWLSYLEKPKLSGIHIHQDSVSKICTIVAGSDELMPNPTLIYQLDSNSNLVAAKRIEPSGKNITSSASSNRNRTIITRSVQLTTGQLTGNVICLDNHLNMLWSKMIETRHMVFINTARLSLLGNTFMVGNGLTIPPSQNYSFLCKLNARGDKLWELTDFAKVDTVAFLRLAVDDADNTYTIGNFGKRGLLTKIDSKGSVEWQQSVYYKGETRLSAITASNGFLYVLGADEGSTSEEGKVFISKISAAGQEVWTTLLNPVSSQFSDNHAAIKTTESGDIVLMLYCVDAGYQRALAAVRVDQTGAVINATTYQNNGHESFPRDLFLGKNATVAGIGTLAVTNQPNQYPFLFKSTLPDLLEGRCCFSPLATNQKSVHLALLPASLNFVDEIVNFNDFPAVIQDDTCIIKRL